ncbi:hypothetical protein EXU85_16460 [Spirosoma sp. KCTC 42546]|uniref:restriction endonuclease subunit S n=1 Tax=Spirosoma sp. KCTC 42546 TaxID=2520506 RepID=UPI001156D6F0|nr:restriction endonuclease subunit S [Spirosoma sp. KCTC 42546]QDK80114.1 hypothetical protein EXU85_16460 [Spirosoma sp. KCTC 42546]
MENQTNKLIPELRFPEFLKDGEWEEKKLGEIAELTSSKRVHLADYVSNGIPFFRGKEISQLKNNNIPEDILYISEEQYDTIREKYGVPVIGDILITAVGTLANVYCVKNNDKFYFKDGNLIWMKNITIDSGFLEVLLDVEKEKILASAIGSSQKALTMVALNKLKFKTPRNLEEQQKIADCLSSLDEVIAAHSQKLYALKEHKKGLMQNLFPQEGETVPKWRFPEFEKDGDWEEKKLGSICEVITKGTTPQKFSKAGIRFIKIEAFQNNHIILDKCMFVDEDTHTKELKRSILKEGDILFAIAGATIGKVNIVKKDILPANTNQALAIVRLKEKENKNFILHILKSEIMQRYIQKSISVGAQPNLNLEQMGSFSLAYPENLKEQQKIAECLSSLDILITAQEEKIEQLKLHKKGLMQGLFPKIND